MAFTADQNLEELTGASNPDETYNSNLANLNIGRLVPVTEYGEAVTQYQPAFIKEADDLCYVSDANDAALCYCHGIVSATADSGADGFLYGAGAIVTNVAWDWALDSWVFVADDQTLSQTPGTVPLPVGYPIAPTKLLVMPGRLLWEQSHIADPDSAAALTQDTVTDNSGGTPSTTLAVIGTAITDPGDAPADADALRDDLVTNTIPSIEGPLAAIANAVASIAAQLAKIKTDVAAVRTGSEANNTAIDSILVRLEQAGIDKTA